MRNSSQWSHPLTQRGVLPGVGHYNFPLVFCFAYKINDFFPLLVHACRQQYLNLNKEELISVPWRAKLNLGPLGMPK